MSMTIEQAKSELMQIYGALSPDKQRAIDTLVKQEPKTGHWIKKTVSPYEAYRCSECNSAGCDWYKYCPSCGAKMESEDK